MNPSNSNNDADRNRDIDWRAFRYVANEMTVDEVMAFEEELGTDQGVRDAVVRAVNGTQLIDAALSGSKLVSTNKVGLANGARRIDSQSKSFDSATRAEQVLRRPHRRSVRMVTTVVALLALLLGASFLLPGAQSSLEADEDLVAEMWVDSIGISDGFDAEETVLSGEEEEFELVASSWLLEALDDSEDSFESEMILDSSEEDSTDITDGEVECA